MERYNLGFATAALYELTIRKEDTGELWYREVGTIIDLNTNIILRSEQFATGGWIMSIKSLSPFPASGIDRESEQIGTLKFLERM